MPNFTPNYNLEKPLVSEFYSIGIFNDNADKIDSNLKEVDSRLTEQLEQIPPRTQSLIDTQKVRFVAHRGFSKGYPENTIESIVGASKAGYWGVEFDIKTTSDGVWYLMHDDTVDRTTNGTGSIAGMTAAQVSGLIVDSGSNIGKFPNTKVPTLESALETCVRYGIVPVIEIKEESTNQNTDNLLDILERYNFLDKAFVMSSYVLPLRYIRTKTTRLIVSFLGNFSDIPALLTYGNAGLATSYGTATKVRVAEAHKNGLIVSVFTVNDTNALQNMIDYGVDFVITDQLLGGGVI